MLRSRGPASRGSLHVHQASSPARSFSTSLVSHRMNVSTFLFSRRASGTRIQNAWVSSEVSKGAHGNTGLEFLPEQCGTDQDESLSRQHRLESHALVLVVLVEPGFQSRHAGDRQPLAPLRAAVAVQQAVVNQVHRRDRLAPGGEQGRRTRGSQTRLQKNPVVRYSIALVKQQYRHVDAAFREVGNFIRMVELQHEGRVGCARSPRDAE